MFAEALTGLEMLKRCVHLRRPQEPEMDEHFAQTPWNCGRLSGVAVLGLRPLWRLPAEPCGCESQQRVCGSAEIDEIAPNRANRRNQGMFPPIARLHAGGPSAETDKHQGHIYDDDPAQAGACGNQLTQNP